MRRGQGWAALGSGTAGDRRDSTSRSDTRSCAVINWCSSVRNSDVNAECLPGRVLSSVFAGCGREGSFSGQFVRYQKEIDHRLGAGFDQFGRPSRGGGQRDGDAP